MADQFLYGQAGTLYFPVFVAGGTRFATNGDWTPGGTNTTIFKDGVVSGFAAATVSYVGSKVWALPLSATELQCKRFDVLVQEPGTIDDQMLAVDTIQNDSAHWPAVLGSIGTVDQLTKGTVGLAVIVAGGTVDEIVNDVGVNGSLNLYGVFARPAYNVNDDKLVVAGWVEKDGLAQNATSATFNLYTYDGTLVYGSSAWDSGPTEVAALNSWFVEKNTATNIKGGTVYFLHSQFDVGGVIYTRIDAFGAYGTGTGA